jgi:4-phytase/acid phosphatase
MNNKGRAVEGLLPCLQTPANGLPEMKISTAKSVRRITSVLLFAACACASEHAFAQADASTDDELRSVIILVRHGVRAPIESEIRASSYNAQRWPSWPVAEGASAAHGTKALNLLGEWYRTRYASLLKGTPCDQRGIYAEANTTQTHHCFCQGHARRSQLERETDDWDLQGV